MAATHGRAFWILDDLTPLRQAAADMADITLYAPQRAVRLFYPEQVDSRHPVGQNPPAGALIDYVFKVAPKGEVSIDILGADGKVLRHMSSAKTNKQVQPQEWPDQIVASDLIPAKAGMNRLVWDLRMDDPVQIPGAVYSDQAPRGPIVAPGTYTVRLTAGGESRTAPIIVFADPRVAASGPAIAAKTAMAVTAWADIDALHRAVNRIRDRRKALKAAGKTNGKLDGRLAAVEERLMQVNMNGSEANLAFPGMLNEQYASFAETLEDADTLPTRQQQALFDSLHGQLRIQLGRLAEIK